MGEKRLGEKKKIGILMGGSSAEREVSLRTGEAVYEALQLKGYACVKIDLNDNFNFTTPMKEHKIEFAFLALHGKHGEDGAIQGLLEVLGIPYTGSGILSSALAMDKIATKKMLLFEGLPTPKYQLVQQAKAEAPASDLASGQTHIIDEMGLPLVVKAPMQGSSIGLAFVRQKRELHSALAAAFQYGPVALVEEFITGMEIHATILGNEAPVALPLIEVVSATGVYDYEAKYTPGMSSHIIPPRLPEKQQEIVKDLAVRAFKALGCRGLARVDFIVDPQGRPYILELNTIPGLTATSLAPDAARAAGIEFPELVERMVRLALE